MAFRLANDDIALTDAEQQAAVREFCKPGAKWAELDPRKKTDVMLAYIKRHPEANPDNKPEPRQAAPVAATAGFVTAAALDAILESVLKKLCKDVGDYVRESNAELESQFSITLQDVLLAAQSAEKAMRTASGAIDPSSETATLKSHAHRLDRVADHLASLETSRKQMQREISEIRAILARLERG